MNDINSDISPDFERDPELSGWLDADRTDMPVADAVRLRLRESIALRRALVTPTAAVTPTKVAPAVAPGLSPSPTWSWRSAVLGTVFGTAVGSVLTWAALSGLETPSVPTIARDTAVSQASASEEPQNVVGSGTTEDSERESLPASLERPTKRVSTDGTAHGSATGRTTSGSATDDEAVSTLRREQLLLEGARSALSRGQFADAISLATAHGRQFPSGLLQEEREFVWIRALEGSGQLQAAITRAEDFVTAYPTSPYARRIEALIPTWRRGETAE